VLIFGSKCGELGLRPKLSLPHPSTATLAPAPVLPAASLATSAGQQENNLLSGSDYNPYCKCHCTRRVEAGECWWLTWAFMPVWPVPRFLQKGRAHGIN
jgi:hypothetical protein